MYSKQIDSFHCVCERVGFLPLFALLASGCLSTAATRGAARVNGADTARWSWSASGHWPVGMVGKTRIPEGAFVRAAGTELTVNGKPFAFVGANFDGIHGDEQRVRLGEVLLAMAEDGITVGRQWVVGEDAAGACQKYLKPYLFRCGPDGFLEETYQQLDRVLAQSRDRGIRVILTLSNQWSDYGGIPMYLRWAGLPTDKAEGELFYADPRVQGFFRAGLDRLLSRVNTVTGQRYIDDPTIFSWELMNESSIWSPRTSHVAAAARRKWIVEMARYIKARDPNHLVGAGIRGYALQSQRQEWIEVHRLPEVDYCDSHLYPQEESQITSWELLRDFLSDRAHLARVVIRKPLIIGEFGFRTDRPLKWLGIRRSEWVTRLLNHVRAQGAAGALVWIYQPYYSRPRDYGIYIDRPYTDDVRRAVRSAARQVAASLVPRPPTPRKTGTPPAAPPSGPSELHRPGNPPQTTGQVTTRPPA